MLLAQHNTHMLQGSVGYHSPAPLFSLPHAERFMPFAFLFSLFFSFPFLPVLACLFLPCFNFLFFSVSSSPFLLPLFSFLSLIFIYFHALFHSLLSPFPSLSFLLLSCLEPLSLSCLCHVWRIQLKMDVELFQWWSSLHKRLCLVIKLVSDRSFLKFLSPEAEKMTKTNIRKKIWVIHLSQNNFYVAFVCWKKILV